MQTIEKLQENIRTYLEKKDVDLRDQYFILLDLSEQLKQEIYSEDEDDFEEEDTDEESEDTEEEDTDEENEDIEEKDNEEESDLSAESLQKKINNKTLKTSKPRIKLE